jgi:hypothetical protein
MITKMGEEAMLPAASFMNVGSYLRHQSVVIENDLRSVNSELTESKNGILIVDNFDPAIVSYESVDIEAIDDIQESFVRKDRIIHMLMVVCLLLTTVSAFLFRESVHSKRSIERLQTQFEESEAELAKIRLSNFIAEDRPTFFHLSNCYFDMRAAASLGECGEDVTQSLNSWYQWGFENSQRLFSFFDSTMDKDMEETKNITYEDNWWSDWTFEKVSSYLSINTDGILQSIENLDE